MTYPLREYPKSCVACKSDITEPLYEFGDLDAVLCQSCHLELLEEGDTYQAVYRKEPIFREGKVVGHTTYLTSFGVVFFDGKGFEGEIVSRVMY